MGQSLSPMQREILKKVRLKIMGVETDRDLSDLVNEAIGDLVGKHEKR